MPIAFLMSLRLCVSVYSSWAASKLSLSLSFSFSLSLQCKTALVNEAAKQIEYTLCMCRHAIALCAHRRTPTR